MIVVRLATGQTLRFPDNTPPDVIERAKQRVLSGELDRGRQNPSSLSSSSSPSMDLSRLRTGAVDLSHVRPQPKAPAPSERELSPEVSDDRNPNRSPEWWQSVSGSPEPKGEQWARERELRIAEERGPSAMAELGFEDREMYYLNPVSGERVLKRRRVGKLPEAPAPQHDRLYDAYAMEGRPVPRPEDLDVKREFVRTLPDRVAGSIAANVGLPMQATEAVARGVVAEGRALIENPAPRSTGEGFRRGASDAWRQSPYSSGEVERRVVEPARDRLLDAATAAGMSPEAAAFLDTGQAATAEALNPGNYIGLDMVRGAVAAGDLPAAARVAALEARGGARQLDDAAGLGLVGREYGHGMAPSELEQIRAARSGRYATPEPLIYRDAEHPRETFLGLKGRLPDALRDAAGRPWRHYEDTPLDRPATPTPRPRDVPREPIPLPRLVGGTTEEREKVAGLWDYASRRYPRITSQVRAIEIGPKSSFDTNEAWKDVAVKMEGKLKLKPEHTGDLSVFMHELTHAAQWTRGKTRGLTREQEKALLEPSAIRMQEVYGRVALPQPKPATQTGPSPASMRLDDYVRDNADNYHDWVLVRDHRRAVVEELETAAREGRAPNAPFAQEDYPELFGRGRDQLRSGGDVGSDGGSDLWSLGINSTDGGADISQRFTAFLTRAGLDDPDAYYDLPAGSRKDLDARFAAEDAGPGGPEWGAYLDEMGMQEADYRSLGLADRIKQEDAFAEWRAGQVKPEDEELDDPRWYYGPLDPGDGSLGVEPPPADTSGFDIRVPPPPLPEEIVAERMGWKPPSMAGPPRAVGPTTRVETADYTFQTNIAAQLGGDEQVANYVIQQSDEVFRAIGPPQSWDTLEEMAARLGTTRDEFLRDASQWNVLSPELRLRLTYVIKGNEAKISGLQDKLVAGGASDADKAELLRLIETRGDLIRLGAKTGSAYGRALNSLKIEARLALGDDQLLRQKLYRQYQSQIDAERPLLDTLAKLDPNDPDELQTFLRLVNRPGFDPTTGKYSKFRAVREYLQEYWVASVLSGPASHERNLIGNAVNAVLENAIVRPVAAGFDAARVAGTGVGAAGREVFLRETPAAVVGLTRGIRLGIHRGWEVLKRGYDPETMKGKLFPVRSAFARSQNRVVREVVGPVVTVPLRLLAASDALFKTMNHTAEIYAQAARIAAKEGLSGGEFATRVAGLVSNPTDEMIEAADNFALKATFNDEASAIGKAIMNLRDIPNAQSANPGIQAAYEGYRTLAGFMIPFVKIADRLMVRGFEYTPAGAISAIGARRAGDFVGAADLAARSALGSTVLAYAGSLAMEGRLTAAAPSDEAERAAFFRAGKQPWSVRTDDGVWIPYGGLQPIAMPFAFAAAAWRGWVEHGESPDVEKLGHAAAEIGVYVTDQSYMDGLSKFMEAIGGSDSERGRAFSDLATNTTWGLTPYSGLTRTVARAVDPRLIDAQTIRDRLKQNVPGWSLGMDARLTPWGEEVVPTGGRLRTVLAPGSILLPSQERKGTPVMGMWIADQATRDLAANQFDTPLTPTEEPAFEAWRAALPPSAPEEDKYDLRGAFRAGLAPDAAGNLPHGFEKPWHPNFSEESVYAQNAPGLAGRWEGGSFIPPPEPDYDGELERLGIPLGYVGKTLSDKLGKGPSRGTWKLSAEEWHFYQQTAGETSKLTVGRVFRMPAYHLGWDAERQREEVEKAIQAAREFAKIQTVRRFKRGMGWQGPRVYIPPAAM